MKKIRKQIQILQKPINSILLGECSKRNFYTLLYCMYVCDYVSLFKKKNKLDFRCGAQEKKIEFPIVIWHENGDHQVLH